MTAGEPNGSAPEPVDKGVNTTPSASAEPLNAPGESKGQAKVKGKGSARSARRHSREVALQGLYQWLLSGEDAGAIQAQLGELEGFAQADAGHLDTLLNGCIREAGALDALIAPHIDRAPRDLSPVEHVALMIGSYELRHCIDIPYRVVINEAVELTKAFGGTDGHKYVNGVLDKVAGTVRAVEVQAHRR